MERLELSQDNLLEPKSSASTSSATFAFCMNAALYLLIGHLTSYKFKNVQSDAYRYIEILLKLELGNTPTRDGVCNYFHPSRQQQFQYTYAGHGL